jgi:hypothetical protein
MDVPQSTPLPPEYTGLTFEKVWATIQETGKQIKETSKQMQETDKKFQETDKKFQETDRLLRENQKMMSDLGRKFGTVIEHMFIPNLEKKFNALGHEFGKAVTNMRIGIEKHNIYTEVDVFLENGDCALAVEVKTQANIDDVWDHMERMGKLRRYFDLNNDKRKLYGAVAAAIIHDNVRDFALKQGFYVIEQLGDNVAIKEPEGSVKAW